MSLANQASISLANHWTGKQALLRARAFPMIPQMLFLLAFVLAIAGAWGVDATDAKVLKELRNTNLANLAVWSFWFPLVIASAVLFGRLWCMVCPMELVTSWSARVGLRLRVPRWVQSGWLMPLLYFTILFFGIHCFSIHRSPERMAWYMLTLLALSAGVGLLFEKRAFCAFVCPVGPLLRLYSKMAPVTWRVQDQAVCEGCKTKDCIAARHLYHWQGRSCGNSIYPPAIVGNGECILCTQCAKVCPNDNPTLALRRPFADFVQPEVLRSVEACFLLIVSGFVIYELLTEWKTSEAVLLWAPDYLKAALGIADRWYAGLVHATLIFLGIPLTLWLSGWVIDRLRGAQWPFPAYLTQFAIAIIPIAAAGHLCKATLKTTTRLAYLPHVAGDPIGLANARAIADGSLKLQAPGFVAAQWPVTILLLTFLSVGLAVSLLALRGIRRREGRLPVGPAVVAGIYWLILAGTITLWRVV